MVTIDIAKAVLIVAFTPNCSRDEAPTRCRGFGSTQKQSSFGPETKSDGLAGSAAERHEAITLGPAPHACRRGTRKMGDAHDRGLIAKTIKHCAPCCSGLDGIIIGHHPELRISSLQRRMDHVPGDQRVR